jgi:hypothetical protein
MSYAKLQENLVGKFDLTDLDLEYYYSEEKDENDDPIRIDIELSDETHFTEVPPAKIDDIINGLVELKNKGSEYVYIADHTDHHGYYFYGIKLTEYVPKKVSAWKCVKAFPGANVGEIYLYDPSRNRYYEKIGGRHNYTSFKDFEKFPELFEKIEIEI